MMVTQKEIIEANTKDQEEIYRILNTLQEYSEKNITSQDSVLPVIGLDDNGQLGLFETSGDAIQVLPLSMAGGTVEKVIVQKEIIVASDSANKQTVQELDFNSNDFAADRDDDPSILRISLKNRPDFNIFVGDSDPTLSANVIQGNIWFYTILGKMYVRYQNFWIQPHPE